MQIPIAQQYSSEIHVRTRCFHCSSETPYPTTLLSVLHRITLWEYYVWEPILHTFYTAQSLYWMFHPTHKYHSCFFLGRDTRFGKYVHTNISAELAASIFRLVDLGIASVSHWWSVIQEDTNLTIVVRTYQNKNKKIVTLTYNTTFHPTIWHTGRYISIMSSNFNTMTCTTTEHEKITRFIATKPAKQTANRT
jgi:hypothetical protein